MFYLVAEIGEGEANYMSEFSFYQVEAESADEAVMKVAQAAIDKNEWDVPLAHIPETYAAVFSSASPMASTEHMGAGYITLI